MSLLFDRWKKTKLKLPPLKEFTSKDKEQSPFYKFHMWAAEEMGGIPQGKSVIVGSVLLHKEDFKKLMLLADTWLKDVHKIKSGVSRKRQLSWLNLGEGPADTTLDEVPDWLIPGYAYVDKKNLFKKCDIR